MNATGVGQDVGRYTAALVKPVLWGLLVGGTGLAVFPTGGSAWAATAAVTVTLVAVKPPRGTRLLDLPPRSQLLRVVVATAVAVVAAAFGVAPSAFVVGGVLHLSYKAMRWRPVPVATVAACAVVLVAAGWFVPTAGPHVLLTSGDPVSLGAAARDLVRFLVLGFLVWSATQDQRTLDRIAAERDTAVRDERVRIARELHDVVAHHVSVMTIQAEALGQPAVAETGRTAMTELRRMLGVLRSPSGTGTPGVDLAPQPTAADLERLVDDVRSTGTTVELDVDGSPEDVPEGVALSVYRIVQESLTNAIRHSPGQAVTVQVTYLPSAVHVEVTNGGRASSGRAGVDGHGIVGMRERARLLDGSLTAGPGDDGTGWVVRAELPLDTSPLPA